MPAIMRDEKTNFVFIAASRIGTLRIANQAKVYFCFHRDGSRTILKFDLTIELPKIGCARGLKRNRSLRFSAHHFTNCQGKIFTLAKYQ